MSTKTSTTLLLAPALFGIGALTAQAGPAFRFNRIGGVEETEEAVELVDRRPEIKELVQRLGAHVKKRGDEDREAEDVVRELSLEYVRSGPKDRAAIVKALDKALSARRRELEEDVPDNQLHRCVAKALGMMGPESVKTLARWVDHKSVRGDKKLQRDLILALGNTRGDGAIEPLMDLLKHHDPLVQGASAEALGQFEERDGDERKEIFEGLLKELMQIQGAVDADVTDTIARHRYDVLAAPIITSLKRLSGQSIPDPHAWRRWWNKNKRDDWERDRE